MSHQGMTPSRPNKAKAQERRAGHGARGNTFATRRSVLAPRSTQGALKRRRNVFVFAVSPAELVPSACTSHDAS